LSAGERAAAWLAGHEGRARVIVGTRLAVFASLPKLAIIVIDEEHDPSYKAGEGVRYSARDLAVQRAQLLGIPVVLGSATPSLESWSRARSGHYRLLTLPQRIAG
jgi:primosomal protein N' (replication factor Y)